MAKLSAAAREVLRFHRERREEPAIATHLVGLEPGLNSFADLQAAYAELLEARLVEPAESGTDLLGRSGRGVSVYRLVG